MLVAREIYTFDTENKIVKYISNVCPNGVPFPFAYCEIMFYYVLYQKYVPFTKKDVKRIKESWNI